MNTHNGSDDRDDPLPGDGSGGPSPDTGADVPVPTLFTVPGQRLPESVPDPAPESGAEHGAGGGNGDGDGGEDGDGIPIPTRQDVTFKKVMGVTANAASMLAVVLPPKVAARLDFEHIKPAPNEYVSRVLRRRNSDLVFWVPMRGADRHVFLHCLVEHQSKSDPLMPVRCLIYGGLMLDDFIRKNPKTKKVPGIISLVVHQGLDGRWTAPTQFQDVIDLEPDEIADMSDWLWKCELVLDDLHAIDVEALRARDLTLPALLVSIVLKVIPHVRKGDMAGAVLALAEEFREAERQSGTDSVEPLYAYLGEEFALQQYDEKVWLQVLEKIGPEAVKTGMTFLDTYKASGRAELLLLLLEHKFGAVPGDVRLTVEGGTDADQMTWGSRILTASTLKDVFASPDMAAS